MRAIARAMLRCGEPRGLLRAAALTLAVVAGAFVVKPAAFRVDGFQLTDTHAMVSLDLALSRAWCGVPSSFAWQVRVGRALADDMERRHEPLRTLVAERAGSVDGYCQAVNTPFVNSENSLMLVETAILRAMPNLSFASLGQALHVIRIACVSVFVWMMLVLGSGVGLAAMTMLSGLMLLQSMPDFVYSNYPFLFAFVLLAAAVHTLKIARGWGERIATLVIYAVLSGALTAFIANMRTSYLPIMAAFFVLVLADELRGRGRVVVWSQRALRLVTMIVCFSGGYVAFETGLITRHLVDDGRYNASHAFAHPLVLALAIPENPFSQSKGIVWDDAVGPRLAVQIEPDVTYLGQRYNDALLRYYSALWTEHRGEMLRVYQLKFSIAGANMITVLRRSPGVAGLAVRILLSPMSLLPNGLWFTAMLVAIGGWSTYQFVRRRSAPAFALTLLSLAALLVQIETGMIFSLFVRQYHNYSVFYVLFVSLLAGQSLVNSVAGRIERREQLRADGQ